MRLWDVRDSWVAGEGGKKDEDILVLQDGGRDGGSAELDVQRSIRICFTLGCVGRYRWFIKVSAM